LFSVLTDSDRLDTEGHFDPTKLSSRKPPLLTIDSLILKLDHHLKTKSQEGEINQLRNEVRETALKKAIHPSGFFSLNLPTGLGKTLTSMAWALEHAKANKLKRIIIVLPFINIIDQTAQTLKEIFGEELVLEHHSSINDTLMDDDSNYNQKKLASENWDYPIIVTTSVQFFESLFSNKPSKARKVHHIAESVVVFDEVQTLKKELVAPTLTMLRNFQKLFRTSFLFCTATLPAFQKREGFSAGIKQIVPLAEDPALLFDKTRRVDYHILDNFSEINMDQLSEKVQLANQSTLVVFNTKKDARLLYEKTSEGEPVWQKRYHLSTLMCPAHRKQIIEAIRSDLKAKTKILVSSTQLIEAGVDFDFPVVFRALAPLESIIQSAGRCNREDDLEQNGQVYLFCLAESKMPDKTYEACASHARLLIQNDSEQLHHHDFFENYYQQVMSLFVDADKNKINEARKAFNFKTVSEAYHLIDEATQAVFVRDYNEDSQRTWDAMRYKPYLSRDDYRKLQPYCVSLYPNNLKKGEALFTVTEQDVYLWLGAYHSDTGLQLKIADTSDWIV